ncbi:hypothetical protein BS50DRAFT_504380, partial [Corynespora cassiicola Philippines]
LCLNRDFNNCNTIFFYYSILEFIRKLNDKVSSFKANSYKYIFYNNTGCRNGGGQIDTTGDVVNIRTHPSFSTINDDISSFICNI